MSYIFICGNKAYLWNTVLIGLLFAGSCDISSPLRSISPLVGISNPAIILNVVVLPHPDGPRKVTNSPLFTSRLKSSTALNPLSLYTLLICLNSIILSAIVLLLHLLLNLLIQHVCLLLLSVILIIIHRFINNNLQYLIILLLYCLIILLLYYLVCLSGTLTILSIFCFNIDRLPILFNAISDCSSICFSFCVFPIVLYTFL